MGADQATVIADPAVTGENADGRRARRNRNREAVVDALLALYGSGNLDPGSAEIAERAGLSPRSLFRYFDDVDDLCRAAITRQQERILPATVITATPDAPFAERIEAIVASRLDVFALMGAVGVVARLRAPFLSIVADELTLARAFFRGQIELLFAAELAAMSAPRAAASLAASDLLLSFESHELLRTDRRLDTTARAAVLTAALTTLLTPAPEDRP